MCVLERGGAPVVHVHAGARWGVDVCWSVVRCGWVAARMLGAKGMFLDHSYCGISWLGSRIWIACDARA